MSTTIHKYVLVDENDQEGDSEFDTLAECVEEAKRRRLHAVIKRTYSYDDSTLVWTPPGIEGWPPPKGDVAELLRR